MSAEATGLDNPCQSWLEATPDRAPSHEVPLSELHCNEDDHRDNQPGRLAKYASHRVTVDHAAQDYPEHDQLAVAAVSAVCESTRQHASTYLMERISSLVRRQRVLLGSNGGVPELLWREAGTPLVLS